MNRGWKIEEQKSPHERRRCSAVSRRAGRLCKTFYFAGRALPPSGLQNRVMIAIQNPASLSKGELEIVDAFYDSRSGYNGKPGFFSIAGYGGALPSSIQNMRSSKAQLFTVQATAPSP